jgi:hypothetical protein
MALKLLVDTCVWIDLARDYREQPVIGALGDLIKARAIDLVVPQIVLDELERNKARIITETQRSLQSHFRLVREAVNRFGDEGYKAETLKALNEVDHKIIIKRRGGQRRFRSDRQAFKGCHCVTDNRYH